jgi:hypothetical protein
MHLGSDLTKMLQPGKGRFFVLLPEAGANNTSAIYLANLRLGHVRFVRSIYKE